MALLATITPERERERERERGIDKWHDIYTKLTIHTLDIWVDRHISTTQLIIVHLYTTCVHNTLKCIFKYMM